MFSTLDAAANVPPPDVVSIESPSESTTDKIEDTEVCVMSSLLDWFWG